MNSPKGLRPTKWASITMHDRLPPVVEQIAAARAWGAIEDWKGVEDTRVFIDNARGVKTTKWSLDLPQRALLLDRLAEQPSASNHVFFSSPLCVGFTRLHAEEVVEGIFEREALIYIHSLGCLFQAGDDMTFLFELVARQRNASLQKVKTARGQAPGKAAKARAKGAAPEEA